VARETALSNARLIFGELCPCVWRGSFKFARSVITNCVLEPDPTLPAERAGRTCPIDTWRFAIQGTTAPT